jgi:ElaB/YqjD/DUF883 family membrane-anchored ribosome-binding protein
MTQTAQDGGQSTTDQAKEKVQETAQQVQEKAQEVKSQASDRLREQLDQRSTQTGAELHSTADAIRRTGQQLREDGKERPAQIADTVAQRAERLGSYMTDANADRMLRDAEDFARRQPWLVAIGGAALGFIAARFMKASSSRRYESSDGYAVYGGPERYAADPMYSTPLPPATGALPATTGIEPLPGEALAGEMGGTRGAPGQ